MIQDRIPYRESNVEQDVSPYTYPQQSIHGLYSLPNDVDTLQHRYGNNEEQFYTEKPQDASSRHNGVSLPFALEQTDGIFALLLICFLFFSYVGGISFLKENISTLFKLNKKVRLHREVNIKDIISSNFLRVQAIILIAICLYDIFMEYSSMEVNDLSPFLCIMSFAVFIGLFFFLRLSLYRLVGYIFDIQDRVQYGIRICNITLEVLGVLFFIPTLLLIYSDYWHSLIIGFMLILFLIAQFMLFYRITIFFIREKFNFLFLIAYLCSVEFIPYIFLSVGLIYLYKIDVFSSIL